MGMYDRDWYREERRQARQAAQHQPQPIQPEADSRKGRSTRLLAILIGAVLGYFFFKIALRFS